MIRIKRYPACGFYPAFWLEEVNGVYTMARTIKQLVEVLEGL